MAEKPEKPPVTSGFSSAVQVAIAAKGTAAIVPAEQLALIPEPARNEDPAPPGSQGAGKPGRPPGALNKRTQEWVDHILARYPSPLIFLAETYSRPVEQLAAEIGCDRDEAFKVQIDAAKNLAPYLHQRQPLAVQLDSRGVVQIILEAPGESAAAAPGAGDGPLLEINANQGVSE